MHAPRPNVKHFYANIKRWKRCTLQNRFLNAAAARFVVAERDAQNAPDEIGESWILQNIFQSVAVRGTDELNTSLADRPSGIRLALRAYFVNDNCLRSMILHSFYQY
jgi:hypothetical protein